MSNQPTAIKNFSPVISNRFGFSFIEIDRFNELVLGVDWFFEFFTRHGFRNFVHKRNSLELIFFFNGVNLFLHLFVHVGLLFFNVVDSSPWEFFLVVGLLKFVFDFQQQDWISIDLFVRFLVEVIIFEVFLLFQFLDFLWRFFFWWYLVLLGFFVALVATHLLCWKVVYYN